MSKLVICLHVNSGFLVSRIFFSGSIRYRVLEANIDDTIVGYRSSAHNMEFMFMDPMVTGSQLSLKMSYISL